MASGRKPFLLSKKGFTLATQLTLNQNFLLLDFPTKPGCFISPIVFSHITAVWAEAQEEERGGRKTWGPALCRAGCSFTPHQWRWAPGFRLYVTEWRHKRCEASKLHVLISTHTAEAVQMERLRAQRTMPVICILPPLKNLVCELLT